MTMVEEVEILEELQDVDEIDEVYERWNNERNMTADELRKWSENPCSREASGNPVRVMRRNLRLMTIPRSMWGEREADDAKRAISFIAPMKAGSKPKEPRDGPHGCPSKWAISLMNWGFNPFDEIPEIPDDEDLDVVGRIEMSDDELYEYMSNDDDVKTEEIASREQIRKLLSESDELQEEIDKAIGTAVRRYITGELAEAEVHEPEFDGTTEGEWSAPDLEDFTDAESWSDLDGDEKSSIGNHFIISKSGFPADKFGDLTLPVVDPNGNLNLNALQNAKARAGQVEGVPSDAVDRAVNIINRLANDNFDADFDNSGHEPGDDEDDEMSDDESRTLEEVESFEVLLDQLWSS